jgi:predicted dehydrogenase
MSVLAGGPLKVAVIGCGAIATEHLRFLCASRLAKLAAVCDLSEVTAKFAQERFSAEERFTDAGQMLKRIRPEVVHIVTPPQTHGHLTRLSLASGAHVICEKPLAPNSTETAELLELAAQHGKTLVESRNLLFNDVVLNMKRIISEGKIGLVREVDLLLTLDLASGPFGDLNLSGPGVNLPGGAVHDFLPHLAYLFLDLITHEGPVDEVSGYLANVSGNPRVGFDHLDALVKAGSRRGRLRVAPDVKPDIFRVIVRGTKGSVETDFYNPFLRMEGVGAKAGQRTPLDQLRPPIQQLAAGLQIAGSGLKNLSNKILQHGTLHGMPRMLAEVYKSLTEGSPPPIRAVEVLASAMLIDRLVELGNRN